MTKLNSAYRFMTAEVPNAWLPVLEKTLRLKHALDAIEASEPVEDWRIDDLQVWPILRQMAGSFTQRTMFTERDSLAPVISSIRRKINVSAAGSAVASNVQVSEPFSNLPEDVVWLIGDVARYSSLGGRRFHNYYDPLRAELEALGQATHAFLMHQEHEIAGQTLLNAMHSSSPIKTFVDRVNESTSWHWQRTGQLLEPMLARMHGDPVLREFVSLELSLHPEYVRLFIARVLTMRDWLHAAMRARRPKAVIFYPSFTPLCYGMAAAARQAGVRGIEMQHGINSRMHEGYTWSRVPDGGWNCTSEEMLTWTRSDADHFQGMGNRVAHLNGPGSLRLARYLLLEEPGRPDRAEVHARARATLKLQIELIHAVASRGGATPVLLAPQFKLRRNSLEAALEAMAQRSNIALLRREHPVAEMRRAQKGGQFEFDETAELMTTALLPAVLANCAGVVTGFSSIFLEASLLGCPTISITPSGPVYYASYLEEFGQDMVTFVDDAAALDAAIDRLASPTGDPLQRLHRLLEALPPTWQVAEAILGIGRRSSSLEPCTPHLPWIGEKPTGNACPVGRCRIGAQGRTG